MASIANKLAVPLASPLARGLTAGIGVTASAFPLDVAGTMPTFAYSTKKLTASYDGPALRVVRPSDSATQDIGFDADGLIDAAALDAFLGGQVGKVSIFYDQSGNGNNATQGTDASRPLIETIELAGSRIVVFNEDAMNLPAIAMNRQATHFFGVYQPLYTREQYALVQFGSGTDQSSFLMVTTSGGVHRLNVGTGNSTYHNQTRMSLYEARLGAAGNLVAQNNQSTAAASSTAVTMTGGTIGGTTLAAGYDGLYYCAAAIAYPRELSAGERTALRAALAEMFEITLAPANRLIWVGDSIAAGSATDAPNFYNYTRMVQPELPATAFYNYAGGGQQATLALGEYALRTELILTQYSDTRIVFLALGTNDITVAARTSAQILADLEAYANAVHADGGIVVVATLLPNNIWNAGQQTTRNDVNAGIRAAAWADAVADFAADATMGPQAAAANAALYPDGLHPSRLGHTYLAPIAQAAILSLL